MSRIIVLALVLAASLVGVLSWISQEGRDPLDQRQTIIEHGGNPPERNAAARGDVRTERLGAADEEVLWMGLPEADPRRTRGGAPLVSARGNGVVFRREDAPLYRVTRHRIPTTTVRAAMDQVLAGANAASAEHRWPARVRGPAPGATALTDRWLTDGQVEEVRQALVGKSDPWFPEEILLQTIAVTDTANRPDTWPQVSRLDEPGTYQEGRPVRAPSQQMGAVLEALGPPEQLFEAQGQVWRVRWEVNWPLP